jgi:hypothetical protein
MALPHNVRKFNPPGKTMPVTTKPPYAITPRHNLLSLPAKEKELDFLHLKETPKKDNTSVGDRC